METYPLILDGAQAGTLTVRSEGGWTCFDAACAAAEGIVRISVYGGGREGYLGVLAPEGEGLALHRRLSRAQLRDFPAPIEYAARAGQPCAAPEETAEPTPQPEAEQPASESETPQPEQEPEPPAPQPQPEPPAPAQNEAPPRQETAPEVEDVYWYASPDGALVCFDGERNLIALPAGDERIPDGPGGWPKTIEGRDYVVYRTKDGKLLR